MTENDFGYYPNFKYNYHLAVIGVQVDKDKKHSILYSDSIPVG